MPDIPGHCPGCGSVVAVPLPVEPLFSMQSAALLVPCSLRALKSLLYRHKHDPQIGVPLYKLSGRRQHRMLRGSDIKHLRSVAVSTRLGGPARVLEAQRG